MIDSQDPSQFSKNLIDDFTVVTRLVLSSYFSPEEMQNIEVELRFVPKISSDATKSDDVELRASVQVISQLWGCRAGEGDGCGVGKHYGP